MKNLKVYHSRNLISVKCSFFYLAETSVCEAYSDIKADKT